MTVHDVADRELTFFPVTLAEAKAYVDRVHRHHAPPVGHKFSIGCASGDEVAGVMIVGPTPQTDSPDNEQENLMVTFRNEFNRKGAT